METFALSADVFTRMIHHSRAAFPKEAVGMLGGDQPGRATVALPLRNVLSTDVVCVKRPYHKQLARSVTVIIAACPLFLSPDGKLLLFRAHHSTQPSYWAAHNMLYVPSWCATFVEVDTCPTPPPNSRL